MRSAPTFRLNTHRHPEQTIHTHAARPMSGSSFWGTIVKPGKNGTPLRTKASQLTMVLKQV